MRNIFKAFLILLFVCVFISPIKVNSQNKYTVKVVQPDPVQPPVIREVTVNSKNKNLIEWDITTNENIQGFNIYRDDINTPINWEFAGQVSYPGIYSFIDLMSFAQSRSYRYRISAVDQCGNEIYNTIIHKTIKLSVDRTSDNTNILKWNAYEGFNVIGYEISGGETPETLTQIDSTENSIFIYTDQDKTSKNTYYQVEAIGYQSNIVSAKSANLNSFKTYSNIVSAQILSSTDSLDALRIQIFPNPMSSSALLTFLYDPTQKYMLSILDLSGKLVYQKQVNSGEVEIKRGNLKEGLYILQITGKKSFRKKLMVGRG